MTDFNYNQDFDIVLVETIGEITRTLMFKSFEDFMRYEGKSETTLNNSDYSVRIPE